MTYTIQMLMLKNNVMSVQNIQFYFQNHVLFNVQNIFIKQSKTYVFKLIQSQNLLKFNIKTNTPLL